jgi:hypothetical protein
MPGTSFAPVSDEGNQQAAVAAEGRKVKKAEQNAQAF